MENDNKKSYYLLKILLLGNSGVGKTNLMRQFCGAGFNKAFIATLGIDFVVKTLNIKGKRVRVQIWDTAGQERFHTVTTTYYEKAMGIFLVCDVTDQRSFEDLGLWLSRVKQYAPDGIPVYLLANKCEKGDKRIVTKEQLEKFANEHNLLCREVSAEQNTHVSKSFNELFETILTNTPLNQLKKTQELISYSLPVVTLNEEQKTCLKYICCFK